MSPAHSNSIATDTHTHTRRVGPQPRGRSENSVFPQNRASCWLKGTHLIATHPLELTLSEFFCFSICSMFCSTWKLIVQCSQCGYALLQYHLTYIMYYDPLPIQSRRFRPHKGGFDLWRSDKVLIGTIVWFRISYICDLLILISHILPPACVSPACLSSTNTG